MAQASYGTITIVDTNDIERIYMVYAGSNSDTQAPDKNNFNLWKTDIEQISGNYIWQRTVIKKSGIDITSSNFQNYYGDPVCITGPEGTAARKIESVTPYYYLSTSNIDQEGGNWSEIPAAYPASGTYYYWTKTVTTYDSGSPTESEAVLDRALNSAIEMAREANNNASAANQAAAQIQADLNTYISSNDANITALQSRLKKIWINEETIGDYVAGTYAASGIDGTTFSESDPSTYGYNTLLRHNKLALRYNTIDMTALTTNALTFYIPTQRNRKWVQGGKGLELTADGLKMFHPGDEQMIDALLDSNGLVLKNGGIKSGDENQNGFVYLSTYNYGSNLKINNTIKSTWREIIGTKFGVDYDGTLYASGAVISGAITITDGNIYTKDETEQFLKENIFELDIDYTWDTDEVTCQAVVRKGGEDIHEEYSPQQFTWELETQLETIPLSGSSELYQISDYTVTISREMLGYGVAIILSLHDREEFAPILTNDSHIILPDNKRLLLTV